MNVSSPEIPEDAYIGSSGNPARPKRRNCLEFLEQRDVEGWEEADSLGFGVGIKPISPTGTKRLVRRASSTLRTAQERDAVHKGNIQKLPRGAFRDWGYDLAREEFRAPDDHERRSWIIDNIDKNGGAYGGTECGADRAGLGGHGRVQEDGSTAK